MSEKKLQENILVVKKEILERYSMYKAFGLQRASSHELYALIKSSGEYKARYDMESDPSYKQIIPYIVFRYEDSVFLMQRSQKASEERLKNLYSLGIGGHVREEDLQSTEFLHEWGMREFHEEIAYQGDLKMEFHGTINDDSNDVGKVHLGLLFVCQGARNAISIRSELQSGRLISMGDLAQYVPQMETWSKIVFEYLSSFCYVKRDPLTLSKEI